MNKNLLWKTVFIVAVLLVFAAGILLGAPADWGKNWSVLTGQGVKAAMQNNIHLGLDLKGGTHLILQVQVNDAIKADSQQVVERLKDYLRSANIGYGEVSIPDPKDHPELIRITGVSPNSAGDVRGILGDRLPEPDGTSQPNGDWTVQLK